MLGRRDFPCGHSKARFPDVPGVYDRKCRVCGARFKVLVKVAKYVSERTGHTVHKVSWFADD